MKRRPAGRAYKPKMCAFCGGPIAEQRPVFLVATSAGTIIGPYHAGCAERLSLAQKGKTIVAITPAEKASVYGFMERGEVLPQ